MLKTPNSEGNNKSIRDRVKDIVYGNCIGDALGLLTEFMSKEECNARYPKKRLRYRDKFQDSHRKRWQDGDWTDDSDQMICIMMSLTDKKSLDQKDIGKRIKKWSIQGFEELRDSGGLGLGATTHFVLSHPDFENTPAKAAKNIWMERGKKVAPNGGVMRTSILGIYHFKNDKEVMQNAAEACAVTHADPRCIASCVAVSLIIAKMLQKIDTNPNFSFPDCLIKTILENTYDETSQFVFDTSKYVADLNNNEIEMQKNEFHCYFFEHDLKKLRLDDRETIGYTLKCMASGLWALQQSSPGEALMELIMEGGDADTNGAVAGALLACRYSLQKFPQEWIKELAKAPKEFLEEKLKE